MSNEIIIAVHQSGYGGEEISTRAVHQLKERGFHDIERSGLKAWLRAGLAGDLIS